MNPRARNRLIAVTVIILAVAAAVFWGSGASKSVYSVTVSDAAGGKVALGERVKVTGAVVPGSWDKRVNPMRFEIGDEGKMAGPRLRIVYSGAAPNTFGDDTVAIVTGEMGKDGVLRADDMITKCPSKYQAKSSAVDVGQLLKSKAAMVDKPTKVTGRLKPGSLGPASATDRFVLVSADGKTELKVGFEGSMPEGTKDGATLVATGRLREDGTFSASDVAVAR